MNIRRPLYLSNGVTTEFGPGDLYFGLDKVNNTSDKDKPVSDAVAAELGTKLSADIIRNTSNIILDPGLDEGTIPLGFSFVTSFEVATTSAKLPGAGDCPTKNFLWKAASSGSADIAFRTDGIPVQPGEEYVFEATVAVAPGTTAGSVALIVRRFDREGATVPVGLSGDLPGFVASSTDKSGTWIRLRGRYTVPANGVHVSPVVRLNGNGTAPATGGFGTTQWSFRRAETAAESAAIKYLPDGGVAGNGRPLAEHLRLTPYDFGAKSDAVVSADGTSVTGFDNTSAFQNYFDACRDAGLPWYIPPGKWRIAASVTCWTSGTCDGVLYFPNRGSSSTRTKFRVETRPEDLSPLVTLETIKGWVTPTTVNGVTIEPGKRYSRKIPAITNRRNQYFSFDAGPAPLPTEWASGQTIAVGNRRAVRKTTADDPTWTGPINIFRIYEATTGGTTTGSAPPSHEGDGQSVTSGGITWKYISDTWKTNAYTLRRGPIDNNDAIEPGEGFLVIDEAGNLGHSLFADWNTANWGSGGGRFKTLRETVRIDGLSIVIYDDKVNTDFTDTCVSCTRCNVTFSNCSILNISNRQIAQGFNASDAYNVVYHGCRVHGLLVSKTNYGFQSGRCCDVSYVSCVESNCRRGIDAHKSKYISIVSCSLPSGWGAHYAWWMGSIGCNLGASNGDNHHPVHVAGGDFYVIGGQMHVNDMSGTGVEVRADLFECGGRILIDGVSVILPRNMVHSSDYWVLCDLSGPIDKYNPGRTVEMPDSITITNNTIIIEDDTFGFRPLHFLREQFCKTKDLSKSYGQIVFEQDMLVNTKLLIKNNSVRYSNGGTENSNGNPRTFINIAKPECVIGSGVQFDISDLPGMYLFTYAAPPHTTGLAGRRSQSRTEGRVANIQGTALWRYSYPAFKSVTFDVDTLDRGLAGNNTFPRNTPNDEVIAFNGRNLFNNRYEFEPAAGVVTVAPSGTANADIHLAPSGTGVVRFGTRTSATGTSVNGYITIKDAAGNLVKLATLA